MGNRVVQSLRLVEHGSIGGAGIGGLRICIVTERRPGRRGQACPLVLRPAAQPIDASAFVSIDASSARAGRGWVDVITPGAPRQPALVGTGLGPRKGVYWDGFYDVEGPSPKSGISLS